MIILCDAAISPEILSKGFMGLSNVFATYPISATQYKETDSSIGRDAFAIVEALVRQAGYHRPLTFTDGWGYAIRRALQMHRIEDARAALDTALGNAVKRESSFLSPTGDEYTFEFPYHRKNARFHVWALSTSGVVEADELDGAPPYMAKSRPLNQAPTRRSEPPPAYGRDFRDMIGAGH